MFFVFFKIVIDNSLKNRKPNSNFLIFFIACIVKIPSRFFIILVV